VEYLRDMVVHLVKSIIQIDHLRSLGYCVFLVVKDAGVEVRYESRRRESRSILYTSHAKHSHMESVVTVSTMD
jgi:hypothetical protein